MVQRQLSNVNLTFVMLKLISIGIAVSTFCIGVSGTLLSWSSQTQDPTAVAAIEEHPISTTACRLMEQGDEYDGKQVSFPATAFAIFDGEIILDALPFEECTPINHKLGFPPHLDVTLNPETAQLLNTLRKSRTEVDVLVTGAAKSFYEYRQTKSYLITPTNVQFISAFRPFVPRGGA